MAKIWMRIYRKDLSYIDGPTVNRSYSDKQFGKKKKKGKIKYMHALSSNPLLV